MRTDDVSAHGPRPYGNNVSDIYRAAIDHARIIGAILIRDVRAKMAGSVINYARVALLPILHVLWIVAIYNVLGRTALLGTDMVIFYASGILPFVLFIYPLRSNLLALDENRALLVLPVVYPLDIIIARVLLEIINSFIVIAVIAVFFSALGYDVIPRNPYKTMTGIAATILFSTSFCLPHAIIGRLIPNWIQLCVLLGVGCYVTSGMFFLPSQTPPAAQAALYFNPLAHCVEWIRSGYYETYKEGLLDKRYLIGVIIFQFAIGLCMERALRGKLSQ